MDDGFLKQLLEKERQRSIELSVLLSELEKSPMDRKESLTRDVVNKTLHSCGDDAGVAGFPLLLDNLYPWSDRTGHALQSKGVAARDIGTSDEELFSISKVLVKAYLSMTYRIQVAYQIDLAAKGYTGEEADNLAFYLSRKETYFPWYKTPGSRMRRFVTHFDIFDVSAEDVGLNSEIVHDELIRFYQIWLKYLPRREWDSLVKHIISDRWIDHGQIGILTNRLSPIEIDPDIAIMLKPDGTPVSREAQDEVAKKFGTLFEGNMLMRLEYEAETPDDAVRARQLRFIRHIGRLNPKPHKFYPSLLWGAEES
jgi:hypothetical protein